jgi:hypothetical protein
VTYVYQTTQIAAKNRSKVAFSRSFGFNCQFERKIA